ncbi:MAG: hypothetical protein LBR74_03055 [Eubacterium sp.]|jgi:acetolactate synthase small subunit|nr:hypothetical protein [Eubacterium sp.]
MQRLILKTENSSGVLRRVAGVLSRKGHNIHSFHSDPTPDSGFSTMEITIECDIGEAGMMKKQLLRLYGVFSVDLDSDA